MAEIENVTTPNGALPRRHAPVTSAILLACDDREAALAEREEPS